MVGSMLMLAAILYMVWTHTKLAGYPSFDYLALSREALGEAEGAEAAYRSALEKTDLPAEIRTVVQKQYDGVLRNHDEIRNLRDRFKATAH